MGKQAKFRPLHESILEVIHEGVGGMYILAIIELIQVTKITEGHDEIIVAIKERFKHPDGYVWQHQIDDAIDSLLQQKEDAIAGHTVTNSN